MSLELESPRWVSQPWAIHNLDVVLQEVKLILTALTLQNVLTRKKESIGAIE